MKTITTFFKISIICFLAYVVHQCSTLEVSEPTRQERIEWQFSKVDGSHPGLVRAVKDSLAKPDSFKHIETRYFETKDKNIIRVSMIFSCVTHYNVRVRNRILADVDLNHTVVNFYEVHSI